MLSMADRIEHETSAYGQFLDRYGPTGPGFAEGLSDLTRWNEQFPDAAHWYARSHAAIVNAAGEDAGLFEQTLAATSPANLVQSNLTEATSRFADLLYNRPMGGMKTRLRNLESIRQGWDVTGQKVVDFEESFTDPDSTAWDMWMNRYQFGHGMASAQELAWGKDRVRTLARLTGWAGPEQPGVLSPRQVQAVMWVGARDRTGQGPGASFATLLDPDTKAGRDRIGNIRRIIEGAKTGWWTGDDGHRHKLPGKWVPGQKVWPQPKRHSSYQGANSNDYYVIGADGEQTHVVGWLPGATLQWTDNGWKWRQPARAARPKSVGEDFALLVAAELMKLAELDKAAWNEADYPRAPRGMANGGQFVSAAQAAAANQLLGKLLAGMPGLPGKYGGWNSGQVLDQEQRNEQTRWEAQAQVWILAAMEKATDGITGIGDLRCEVSLGWNGVEVGITSSEGLDFSFDITDDQLHVALFRMPEDLQNKGIANRFAPLLAIFAQANGIKTITTEPGLSVGGYAWAKMGFDWNKSDMSVYDYVKDDFDRCLQNAARHGLDSDIYKNTLSDIAALQEHYQFKQFEDGRQTIPNEYPTPQEMSLIGYRPDGNQETWPGKTAMLSTSWSAKKDLEPGVLEGLGQKPLPLNVSYLPPEAATIARVQEDAIKENWDYMTDVQRNRIPVETVARIFGVSPEAEQERRTGFPGASRAWQTEEDRQLAADNDYWHREYDDSIRRGMAPNDAQQWATEHVQQRQRDRRDGVDSTGAPVPYEQSQLHRDTQQLLQETEHLLHPDEPVDSQGRTAEDRAFRAAADRTQQQMEDAGFDTATAHLIANGTPETAAHRAEELARNGPSDRRAANEQLARDIAHAQEQDAVRVQTGVAPRSEWDAMTTIQRGAIPLGQVEARYGRGAAQVEGRRRGFDLGYRATRRFTDAPRMVWLNSQERMSTIRDEVRQGTQNIADMRLTREALAQYGTGTAFWRTTRYHDLTEQHPSWSATQIIRKIDDEEQHSHDYVDALNRAAEPDLTKYSPDQPRGPKGTPEGGQFIAGTGQSEIDFEEPWHGDSVDRMHEGFAALKSVLGEDFDLASRSIDWVNPGRNFEQGTYEPWNRRLSISYDAHDPAETAIHETGHAIDFAHWKETGEHYTDDAGLKGALFGSSRYGDLQRLIGEHGSKNPWPKYAVQPAEMFARAFSQWVANKSGDRSLQQAVADKLADRGDTFTRWTVWEPDDFKPIADELDRIFGVTGKYAKDQPRAPKGSPAGGQFVSADGQASWNDTIWMIDPDRVDPFSPPPKFTKAEFNAAMNAAMQAVFYVVPDFPPDCVNQIEVVNGIHGMGNASGAYWQTSEKIQIAYPMMADTDQVTIDTIHELGHALDARMFKDSLIASNLDGSGSGFDHPAPVPALGSRSEEFVKAWGATPTREKIMVSSVKNVNRAAYLASKPEAFARFFCDYIAHRSPNEQLRKAVAASKAKDKEGWWMTEDEYTQFASLFTDQLAQWREGRKTP